MNIRELQPKKNSDSLELKKGWIKSEKNGKIISTQINERLLLIKRGRIIEPDGSVLPILFDNDKNFKRIYYLKYKYKYIYCIEQELENTSNIKTFIGLNFFQNVWFLILQKSHWLQKESNIRYLVNLIFLVIGAYIGIKNL